LLGPGGKQGLQDFRWVENVLLGEHQTHVILRGEITHEPTASKNASRPDPLDPDLSWLPATTL
jgi:hypothetical protein